MADDWAVGDLALAVRGLGDGPYRWGPKDGHKVPVRGGIYTVEGVARDNSGNLGLILDGCHSRNPIAPAWKASSFRKIRPLTNEERDSFLADLDAPVSPAAPSRSHAGDRPNDDASNHSPLANPASSLPESVSAPNREALSGSLFNHLHG